MDESVCTTFGVPVKVLRSTVSCSDMYELRADDGRRIYSMAVIQSIAKLKLLPELIGCFQQRHTTYFLKALLNQKLLAEPDKQMHRVKVLVARVIFYGSLVRV